MSALELFQNHLFLNLETFRKNGEGVKTPVWFVQDGDTLLVTTIASSGKAKRARGQEQVNIAPCTVDGTLVGAWCPATISEATEAGIEQKMNQMLEQKYGEMKKKFDAQQDAALKSMKRSILRLRLKG